LNTWWVGILFNAQAPRRRRAWRVAPAGLLIGGDAGGVAA